MKTGFTSAAANCGLFVVEVSWMTNYERFMAERPTAPEFTIKDYLDTRDALIRAELGAVGERLTNGLSDLKSDIDSRFGTLNSEFKTNLHRTVWSSAGAIFLGLIAVVAVVWNAFGTGASMASSFSDRVIASHAEYQSVSAQLNAVNQNYEKISAKVDGIDSKLNRILESYPDGSPRKPKQRAIASR